MMNLEYYKETLSAIEETDSIAIDNETLKPVPCIDMECRDCIRRKPNGGCSDIQFARWCAQEYVPSDTN